MFIAALMHQKENIVTQMASAFWTILKNGPVSAKQYAGCPLLRTDECCWLRSSCGVLQREVPFDFIWWKQAQFPQHLSGYALGTAISNKRLSVLQCERAK